MIYNEDCIEGAKTKIKSETIDLGIYDPPFGINESTFDKYYKRDNKTLLEGYVETKVDDYYEFSYKWLEQAKRIMKPNGSMYVISGWTNLRHILNAADELDLQLINHIIWKFNFGVATKKKFVTSHYHILYMSKPGSSHKFNTYCRYGSQERDKKGSLNYRDIEDVFEIDDSLYDDLEDVFKINKEFNPGEVKNKNKLPNALIEKLVRYSSDPGDVVCDFFMGNFTTAFVSKKLGREPIGFELNKHSFDYWMPKLDEVEFGRDLKSLKFVVNETPPNQGKPITEEEIELIVKDYECWISESKTKKEVMDTICKKYGRGRFGIKNILDKWFAK